MPADRLLAAGLGGLALAGVVLARRLPEWARGCAWVIALGLGAWLGVRWVRAGHPPVFGTFETDLAQTLVLVLSGLWIARGGPAYLRGPLLVAALTFAHTFTLRTEITPLTISERSLWIDAHAVLAWIAWAAYFHALCLAWPEPSPAPGPPREGRALRALGVAFLAQSALGFVGLYYATLLFARPWEWDPVQTLGLLSWLLCTLSLHLRLFFQASLHRQRLFLAAVVAAFVISAKLAVVLGSGQSFHVFELGAMAGPVTK